MDEKKILKKIDTLAKVQKDMLTLISKIIAIIMEGGEGSENIKKD